MHVNTNNQPQLLIWREEAVSCAHRISYEPVTCIVEIHSQAAYPIIYYDLSTMEILHTFPTGCYYLSPTLSHYINGTNDCLSYGRPHMRQSLLAGCLETPIAGGSPNENTITTGNAPSHPFYPGNVLHSHQGGQKLIEL